MANATLTPEVTDVLRRSSIVGNILTLPGQLERKLYEAVNKVLLNAGAKWNRGKKGHEFTDDSFKATLGLALETGKSIDEKKLYQSFYTPPELATRVVEMACVAGRTVFEPSCGEGALALEAIRQGAASVMGFDINEKALEKIRETEGLSLIGADFMLAEPGMLDPFECIVMNPPFTGNQDIKHVAHALKFLAKGGTLVSVMMPTVDRPAFKRLVAGLDHDIEEVEAGAFSDSGTEVRTIILKVRT